MNTSTLRDSVDGLKETARDSLHDLKTTAQERLLDPLMEKGRHALSAARHGAENVAECSRRSVARTGEWVSSNPFSAAGVAFGVGLLAGIYMVSKWRR